MEQRRFVGGILLPAFCRDQIGGTALMLAAQNGHHELAQLLLGAGANVKAAIKVACAEALLLACSL